MAVSPSEPWEALLATSAVEAGQQAELLRRGLLDSTVDCVKIIDLDGRLLYLNPGGHQILEVQDPSQILGLSWLEMWTGENRAAAEAAISLGKQGYVGRFQGFCPTFSGNPRWWDVVVNPMKNAAGLPEQLLTVSRDITELKVAQLSQAREREILEKFAAGEPVDRILESIAGLVKEEYPQLDAAILSWNPAQRLAVGRTSSCSSLIFPISQAQLVSAVTTTAIDGEEWKPLRDHLSSLGRRCFDLVLLTDREGSPTGVFLLSCPIGERPLVDPTAKSSWVGLARLALKHNRHQESLIQSQSRFAALAKVSPVGIFQADGRGARTFVSERWSAISGLTPAEAMGDGWTATIHPEDREAVIDAWKNAVEASSDFRSEYRLLDKNSGITWVIGEATKVSDQTYIGTITDITDVKRAHDALLESSARFELLANNMSQLCWIADEKGWVLWYNQRWFDYTGTTLEQMQGWGWRSVHHPEFVEGVVERISRCWESGEDWEDTFPLRGKDGQYRWFLSRAKPIRDASGKVVRWFGTNTDVTELRQLEDSLARQNLALRRSNQELTQFAYVASHDLQEPLRTISNYTQLLERRHGQNMGEEVRKAFDVIIDSAQRMSKLITDLLLYSRINSEAVDMEQQISLAVAVQDAKVMLASTFRELSAELVVGELPAVRGNRSRLSQVFLNLIGNSLKYHRQGQPPRISVDCRPDGAFWRITVTDNGQGFLPEYSERIFGIFKRLHGREIPGTGIGLALCRSIVERMGGSIGAEGMLGEGSKFWFTLPR